MNLFTLVQGCWFGHSPVKELVKGKLHFRCEQCYQDLGVVLPKQKLRIRKEPKRLSVVKIRRSA